MRSSNPVITNIDIAAPDGFLIGATMFEPAYFARPRGTMIIHGGTAILQTYYRAFAQRAAERGGLRVITYDYRGIGRSRPGSLVHFEATMTDWAKLDARAVIRYARDRFDGRLTMVGHSFGGQMIGLVDEWREADAAILVTTQLGWWGHWDGLERWRMAAVWTMVVPALTGAFGYLPGRAGLGVDLPSGVAREWAAWCRHPRYLGGFHADARDRFAEFDRPTMLFSFTDDDYAPEGSVLALRRRLKRAPLVHRTIDPAQLGVARLGHFGFFRSERVNDLWESAFNFLDDVEEGRAPVDIGDPDCITEEEIMADLQYGR